MSYDNKSGTSVPVGSPHYAQTPSAQPYAGDKVSTAPPPVYTVTPVSVPVPSQTHYVRKVNKTVYRLVWAGIVFCAVIFSALGYKGATNGLTVRSKTLMLIEKYANANMDKIEKMFKPGEQMNDLTMSLKLLADPDYIAFLYSDPVIKRCNQFGKFAGPISLFMIFAFTGFIQLLRAKMTKVYVNSRRNYAITLSIFGLINICGSGFDYRTLASFGICSLVFCPYFFVALGALRDLTGERARRWLPVYYEAVTLDHKTAA